MLDRAAGARGLRDWETMDEKAFGHYATMIVSPPQSSSAACPDTSSAGTFANTFTVNGLGR